MVQWLRKKKAEEETLVSVGHWRKRKPHVVALEDSQTSCVVKNISFSLPLI